MKASASAGSDSERLHYRWFGINPNPRLRCCNGIAVIGFGKQRGFSEELAAARRMEDHQMVIDSAADQAKPTAFDLIDRRCPVALPEQ